MRRKLNDSTLSRIFEIGRALFIANGFHATTIKDISNDANINLAAVNYHYGDKLGLCVAIVIEELRDTRRSMPRIESMAETEDSLGCLVGFVDWFLERYDDKRNPVAALLGELYNGLGYSDPRVFEMVEPESAELISILKVCCPGSTAYQIQCQAACVMTLMTNGMSRITGSLSKRTDAIRQFCIGGVSARSNGELPTM